MCVHERTHGAQLLDYARMRDSRELLNYVALAQHLQRVDMSTADRNTKLAFFINVYNALIVHATATRGPPTTMWQRYKVCSTCVQ